MSFNRPPTRSASSDASRRPPRIWADGSQNPRFDVAGFARVGLLLSRQAARTVLLTVGWLVSSTAMAMAENTLGPRLAGATRFGRILPARTRVANGLTSVAILMTAAADVAAPPPPIEAPVAPQDPARAPTLVSRAERRAAFAPAAAISEPAQVPVSVAVENATPEFDAPTLAAIRAMIEEMRIATEPVPAQNRAEPVLLPPPSGLAVLMQAIPLSPPEPRRLTFAETLLAQAYDGIAGLVAATVTLLMLPVGMAKAGFAHLRGDDLRDWS